MQGELRHDVVRSLFAAEPTEVSTAPIETELTKAARNSVANADKIIEAEEFSEEDFVASAKTTATGGSKKKLAENARKKARKAERQRRKKGKRN